MKVTYKTPVDQALAAWYANCSSQFLDGRAKNIPCMVLLIYSGQVNFQLDTECFLDLLRKIGKILIS